MEFKKLLVAIPSRNRAELAENAINSVLAQQGCEFEVIVSDNSTEDSEIKRLKAFCDELKDKRLSYIRPPEPLTMTKHWDWIMRKVFEENDFSHIIYLTDRMVFKPDSLRDLIGIAKTFPDKIISYYWDSINDYKVPVKLIQWEVTEKLFEIKSSHIFKLTSEMIFFIACLPKMFNTLVPREVLGSIKKKYGNYFSSNAPDFNFAYSSLSIVDSFIYFDKGLIIDYGLKVSNGGSMARGILTKDSKEFVDSMKWDISFETPLPTLFSNTNIVLDEYWKIKLQNSNSKMPEHNKKKYMFSLIKDIEAFENRKLKYQILSKLYSNVGIETCKHYLKAWMDGIRMKYPIRTTIKKQLSKVKASSDLEAGTKTFIFESSDEAIQYSFKNPREKVNNLNSISARIGLEKSEFGNQVSIINYELQELQD